MSPYMFPEQVAEEFPPLSTPGYVPIWPGQYMQVEWQPVHQHQMAQMSGAVMPMTNPSPSQFSAEPMSRRNSRDSNQSALSNGAIRHDCPWPDCKRQVKDLKAHLATHEAERDEKCPVPGCHMAKGFARKFDRRRHICGSHWQKGYTCYACPAPESYYQKNDIFRKHLVQKHGCVSRRSGGRKRSAKSPSESASTLATSIDTKCSTCGLILENFQALHDHVDDCTLEHVLIQDPSEAINEANLLSLNNDPLVAEILRRNGVGASPPDEESQELPTGQAKARRQTAGRVTKRGYTGMTRSAIGGNLTKRQTGNGRQKDGNPSGWSNNAAEQNTVRNRTCTAFLGPIRLVKDQMVTRRENELHLQVRGPDNSIITVNELNKASLQRIEAIHDAASQFPDQYLPNPEDANLENTMEMIFSSLSESSFSDASGLETSAINDTGEMAKYRTPMDLLSTSNASDLPFPVGSGLAFSNSYDPSYMGTGLEFDADVELGPWGAR